MNEEIKEIIRNMFHIIIKYGDDFDELEENEIRYQLSYKQMEKLYNYITNLQKENEHKDKLIDIANAGISNLQEENEKIKNQKSDVIKYIKSLKLFAGRTSGKTLFLEILNEILKKLGDE